eukprot:gene28942-37966_t
MRREVGQVGDGDSFQDWFNNVPPITKVLLVSTLLSGAMLTFQWVSAQSLVLFWPEISSKFEFWRLFTSFIFAGPFSFNFAMHTYVLYENSRRYELNPFNTGGGGSSADYLWMLLLSMICLLAVAYYFDILVLSEPILYVIMYVWSRREPDQMLNIFGFKFKSLYLPWIYIAIRLIMGGSITEPLLGIGVGHLYYFVSEILPVTEGYNLGPLIRTPAFCSDIITYATGYRRPVNTSFTPNPAGQNAAPPPQQQQRNAGGYTWGRGRTLGTS